MMISSKQTQPVLTQWLKHRKHKQQVMLQDKQLRRQRHMLARRVPQPHSRQQQQLLKKKKNLHKQDASWHRPITQNTLFRHLVKSVTWNQRLGKKPRSVSNKNRKESKKKSRRNSNLQNWKRKRRKSRLLSPEAAIKQNLTA